MRIRHLVCTDNFAGVERLVTTASTELARRGHRVEVVGGHAASMNAALAGTTVRFVAAPSTRAALVAAKGLGSTDVVHAHMTGSDLVAIATRALWRAPVVSTLHFAQPRGHSLLTRVLTSVVPRLVTAEIAVSDFVARRVGGAPAVIVNGVPDPAPQRRPSATDRDRVVLVAQRLEAEKATEVALEAFARSALAADGWQLHVAGTGSQIGELRSAAQRLGIGDATSFLGRVDDLEIRMSRAALLLAPAPAEPFGLSVVEAMAAGLPVIAAGAGGHLGTVGSATPETLFDAGDVAAAADLLRRYAEDPASRDELAARGRARYETAFTIEAHVDALERCYAELVGTGRNHTA